MITRIERPGSVRPSGPVQRTAKTERKGDPSFSKHLDAIDTVAGTASASAASPVSGVLNVQEVDDALARAAKGKLRAEDVLQKLDDLRLDLLSGLLSPATLKRLLESVSARRAEVDDPHLNEILDEIDLRAQVELAKFTRA